MDWLNLSIALVLFLITIRDIIASNWDITKKSPKLRFFFSRKEEITADRIMRVFGYNPTDITERKLFLRNARKLKGMPGLLQLIDILSKSTIKSESDDLQFSSHTTKYYIDTMGVAHDKSTCDTLNLLMSNLIRKAKCNFDYVYATKDDNNQLLSSFVNDYDDTFSILAKTSDDKSRAKAGDNGVKAQINYEGFGVLTDFINNHPNKDTITGIAVACNIANGSTLRKSILSYNKVIKELQDGVEIENIIKVQPITKTFILYRAINDTKLDADNETKGITCKRYFDLDENKKQELYEIKTGGKRAEDFSCYKCINDKGNDGCIAKDKCYKSLI